MFTRDKTRRVYAGKLAIGGGAPVAVQSMATAGTSCVDQVVRQISELESLGCELVRLAVRNEDDARAIREIKKQTSLPISADIQFDAQLALLAMEHGIDKIRINPGNTAHSKLIEVAACAKERRIPIRVGVNTGSLEKELLCKYGVTAKAMVESAKASVDMFLKCGFEDLVVSVKASYVPLMVESCRQIACELPFPQHLGVTEAGELEYSAVKSSLGIGTLLMEGIGDTIRASVTGSPLQEIPLCYAILRAAGVREKGVDIVACPTCARCSADLEPIVRQVRARLSGVNKPLKVAIMGCPVNGPGEAKESDFGIACAKDTGVLFKNGKIVRTVPAADIVDELCREIMG
ncbi:MAG: flavodoxin-dependent (E)-4-hydroxy-3-methylbut-2-enyl-diphosphate synthase [Christensenellales bacterium]